MTIEADALADLLLEADDLVGVPLTLQGETATMLVLKSTTEAILKPLTLHKIQVASYKSLVTQIHMNIAGMRLIAKMVMRSPSQLKVQARIIMMPTGTGLEAVGQMIWRRPILMWLWMGSALKLATSPATR